MLETLNPGQRIALKIVTVPRSEADRKTIARLMRQDHSIKKALRGAQRHRERTLVVRSRGKRPWEVRRRCARYANVNPGAQWTMTYIPQLSNDLKSVERFVEIESEG